jgi:hypoxanthine phosphoribosyltransferase
MGPMAGANMRQLLSEAELLAGVDRLAREVQAKQDGRPLTIIAVMTGSLVLMADLMRRLTMPLRIGVIQASSYRGGTQSGALEVNRLMIPNVAGEDVLLLDDIFDTGRTLETLCEALQSLGPRSLRTLVLLEKEGRAVVHRRPDLVGFKIPDRFVVGYGLDYDDLYRNLPYLAELDPADLH